LSFLSLKERPPDAAGTGDVSRISTAVANVLCDSSPTDVTNSSSPFGEKSSIPESILLF
jgi:hypothetical protein